MRLVILAWAIGLACSGAAAAQTIAPLEPAKLDLARQIVASTGGHKAVEAQLRGVFQPMMAGLAKDMPETERKLMEGLNQDLQDEIATMIPPMLDTMTEAYARHLTEKELRDLLAWQTSETGRALIQKMPAITQEMVAKQLPLIKEMAPRMMRKAFERACQQTACTPAQRDAFEKRMKSA
jgi:hypothetical protein